MKRKSIKAPLFMRRLREHLQALNNSIHQLSRSPLATLMTFAVIGIALALPFGLYTILQNIQGISHSLHDSAQISLYVNHPMSPDQKNNLERLLNADSAIKNVQYISPESGLTAFQKDLNFSHALAGLKQNPLPAVFLIQPNTQNRQAIGALLQRLNRLPNITQAQLDMQWLQRLNAILLLLHRALYAIMCLFALGVLLIIGNTIRLTTERHRDTIEVIKLVGGSHYFIRRPFLYSGILYGLAGSIIAWLLVDLSMVWLQAPVTKLSSLYNTSYQLQGLDLHSTLTLLIGGSLLGYLGSRIAVHQQLKTFV